MRAGRIFAAELIGTAVLVIGGPGTAVFATGAFGVDVGVLGVALAFGLSLLVMAYAIGPVSGCHINPAVTVGLWLAKKVETALVPVYVAAQLAGAAIGGLLIFAVANSRDGGFDPNPGSFAVNGWGDLSPGGFDIGGMIIVEIALTALLVLVVLSTTTKGFSPGQGGLTVGLTLTLIHLISIPIDNTSVNPARSFGMAIYALENSITQLWAFVVFPLVGAALGVVFWLAIDEAELDDTMLGELDDALEDVLDELTD